MPYIDSLTPDDDQQRADIVASSDGDTFALQHGLCDFHPRDKPLGCRAALRLDGTILACVGAGRMWLMTGRDLKSGFRFGGLGVCSLVVLLVVWSAYAVAAPPEFIRAAGTQLVDGHGNRFAVRGINLGNWLVPEGYMFKFTHARAPAEIARVIEELVGPEESLRFWSAFRDVYIAEDDIRFIKDAGFNTVRVPLHWGLFVSGAPGAERFEGEGWTLLDRLVEWCRTSGLHVIIDLHAAPGGQTGVNHDDGPGVPLTFYVPKYRRLTIALWREIAARYRAEPAVLGYDLLNEPISPYSDENYLNSRLETFYREIVAAIRSVDTNHVVLLAGAQWGTNFAMFDRPFDTNAVYTYHKFWAPATRASLQDYLNFSSRWNVPLLIGETGELNDDWNLSFRELHERLGIGWCFWTYKNLDSHSTVVSIPKPEGWSLIAKAGSEGIRPREPNSSSLREEARAILWAYLEAAKFKNGNVNASYLGSLGLVAP
jgi:endoglucanase